MNIRIKNEGHCTGQEMVWTERMTNSEITKTQIKVYHYSDTKLKEFKAKITCFFDNELNEHLSVGRPAKIPKASRKYYNHVYELTIPKNTYIERFSEEIRIEIQEDWNLNYIGCVIAEYDYTEIGKMGNPFITQYWKK